MNFSRPLLLKLWRAILVVLVVFLIHEQASWLKAGRESPITLANARHFFPEAADVILADEGKAVYHVLDSMGVPLGSLLTTSPETDSVIGYSGPTNLLIALDSAGTVAGVQLISSGDTPEHVELLEKNGDFFNRFKGWIPTGSTTPRVSAVSGATLTSYAVAESVSLRLTGTSTSLRFPEPITIAEIQKLLPAAESMQPEGRQIRVLGPHKNTLGFVLRTSPEADSVSGYRGPTECLVSLAPDGVTVTGLKLLKSYDTEEYVDYVREDDYYLGLFKGRTITELAGLDFQKEKIEGVSGATQTSWAVAESLKRRMASETQAPAPTAPFVSWAKDASLLGVVAGAILLSFSKLRGKGWLRLTWQAFLIGYVGLACGSLLSLSLFHGWAVHGLPLKGAPGLVLLGLAALVLPWATRRQVYCHQICPHGAAQQCLGALGKKLRDQNKVRPAASRKWADRLTGIFALLPAVLLLMAVTALLLGLPLNPALLEPFDAWVWQAAGAVTIGIAIVGLAASLFIPQAYCRFGCPTGAIFNFLRSSGASDNWGRRDWAALGLLATGLLVVGASRISRPPPTGETTVSLQGSAMGTTWSVKVRSSPMASDVLESAIKVELENVEKLASTWRAESAISRFNQNRSPNAKEDSPELAMLAKLSSQVSQASGGAFDITVGPLVKLWGFGPAPRRAEPPSPREIETVLQHIGWRKLSSENGVVTKSDPNLEIDLSAIAKGWGVDRVAAAVSALGYKDFLIEVGGEVRVSGRWTIAIEHPDRVCELRDESIASSGSYRQNWQAGGKQYSHLLDPRTGKPIAHNTVSASVRHQECALADAWATAFNVLGQDEGLPLAERLGLAVQFVTETPEGRLSVRQSSAWK